MLVGNHLCHLFIAHDARSENTIIVHICPIHDLSLVPLVSCLGVLAASNVHIRLNDTCLAHVVEHDLSFGVSPPLVVEASSVDATSVEIQVILASGPRHIGGILPPVTASVAPCNRPESSLGACDVRSSRSLLGHYHFLVI